MLPVSANAESEFALSNLEYLGRKLGNVPNFVQLHVCVGVSTRVFLYACILVSSYHFKKEKSKVTQQPFSYA